jgi:hypothetical protein
MISSFRNIITFNGRICGSLKSVGELAKPVKWDIKNRQTRTGGLKIGGIVIYAAVSWYPLAM